MSWKRYVNYFLFHFVTFYHLVRKWPEKVFYFETLSFLPVYLYKRFFNRNADVMVHYHEYTSTAEYQNGMKMEKWFHKLETKMYPKINWVSHVIPERMDLFKMDHPNITFTNTKILTNFPPLSWKQQKVSEVKIPVKVFYIGALSMKTMYLKQFSEWVHHQEGKILWDIYSANFESEALEYLQRLNSPYINFKEGINYFDIPSVLNQYDVGVILYTGYVLNHIFSAPNKLFEYLAGDLDVWIPNVLKGCLPFVTESTFPKVTLLDFNHLSSIELEKLIDRKGLTYKHSDFYSEMALLPLKEYLKQS
jgi:hypothetical protein